ncbi:hypothetical protein ACFL31_02835 [Candidatus Margulisiibacteriota bacterium]
MSFALVATNLRGRRRAGRQVDSEVTSALIANKEALRRHIQHSLAGVADRAELARQIAQEIHTASSMVVAATTEGHEVAVPRAGLRGLMPTFAANLPQPDVLLPVFEPRDSLGDVGNYFVRALERQAKPPSARPVWDEGFALLDAPASANPLVRGRQEALSKYWRSELSMGKMLASFLMHELNNKFTSVIAVLDYIANQAVSGNNVQAKAKAEIEQFGKRSSALLMQIKGTVACLKQAVNAIEHIRPREIPDFMLAWIGALERDRDAVIGLYAECLDFLSKMPVIDEEARDDVFGGFKEALGNLNMFLALFYKREFQVDDKICLAGTNLLEGAEAGADSTVLGHKKLIGTIADNLERNANQAGATEKRREVRVEGDSVVVTFLSNAPIRTDTGLLEVVGLEDGAVKRRIFEPFTSTKQNSEVECGLGMAMAWMFMKRVMRGAIDAKNVLQADGSVWAAFPLTFRRAPA